MSKKDPITGQFISEKSLIERFWEKVDKRSPDECWEWQAVKQNKGYGRISRGRQGESMILAHRLSWELVNGPIPAGMCVLHHCDNKSCVNPAHLFLGTNADNSYDTIRKERQARGETHGMAKLVKEDVLAIRRLWLSQRKLAAIYGVGQTQIWRIKHRKDWGWFKKRGV